MTGAAPLRVVYLGNDEWSVPPLEALARSRHEVALVVTRVPRPARRGSGTVPTPVAAAARRLGLPLLETETVKRGPGLASLVDAAPDVLVVVAYGEILPPEVLEIPGLSPVNLHFSLLPELRGAGPVQRAILDGLTGTGVTTMRMDRGMDTGPILLQAAEAIGDHDDAGSLGARLAVVGGRLLVDTLDRLSAGDLPETPQDGARATHAPKLGPEDRRLDWSLDAGSLSRRVRALAPEPGAATTFRGRVLKVHRARPAEGGGEPGTVLRWGAEGLLVAAGEGALLLEEVAPEGRRRMPAADFVRGHRPEEGERLG
ncbi:MAG: methionyl-tRNA formyltransferase [Actinobacteria bacterium]|nr:methionyl-tRNA formyltransferase [Actinomycetota bacterium]